MVSVRIIEKPTTKAIIKKSKYAHNYKEYIAEMGNIYASVPTLESLMDEHIGLWIPKRNNEPLFALGVEVSSHYTGIIPEGFEELLLEESKYLLFQTKMNNDIELEEYIKNFNYEEIDHKLCTTKPRLVLEQNVERGLIVLVPIVNPKLASLM